MPDREFTTASGEETVELGRRIAAVLPLRAVVLLIGTLGAGKTTLAKGLVAGLGAASIEEVSSPTFTLVHEYGGPPTRVYHIDLYRLETEAEVRGIGLEEILDRDAVILLEWAERFPALLPADRLEIRLEAIDAGDSEDELRRITVSGLTTQVPINQI